MKALCFGSIGTIVETSQLQYDAFHAAFAQHGLDWQWDLPTYFDMLKISGGAKRIEAFAHKRNENVDAAAVHATKTAWFLQYLRSDDIKPLNHVGAGLTAAQERGMKTGFVSTTEEETVQIIAQKLIAQGHPKFDVLTNRGLGLPEKPQPDAYLHAFAALGVDPQDALVVEDNVDGVAAAKTAGTYVVGLAGAFVKQSDLNAADLTFSSGSDIDWKQLFG